jgi:hypothetical protein
LLERFALRSIGRFGRHPTVRDPAVQAAWSRVSDAFPDMTSALLIYTGVYKRTVLCGIVAAPRPFFIKVFADLTEHEAEEHRLQMLGQIAPSSVLLARAEFEQDGIVAYELLERSKRRASQSMLENVALEVGLNSYHASRQSGDNKYEDWQEIVRAMRRLLTEFGLVIPDKMVSRLNELNPPQMIAHGDFTPWNAFPSREGRLAVIDYERVDRRAPFTDAWHLATQPLALRGKRALPAVLLARVRDVAECDDSTVLGWYCAYLVQELNQDASDWVVHKRHNKPLRQLITAKTILLEDAISRVDAV